jgi:hypothetical protein
MKRLLLTLLLIITLTGPTWARLGETEAQLTARYGAKTGSGRASMPAAPDMLNFKKSGFEITVYLLNGVSAEEVITKSSADAIIDDEIETLLKVNGNGHDWVEVPGMKAWKRDDDGARAWIGDDRIVLTIASRQLIDANEAAVKAAHATSLKDF